MEQKGNCKLTTWDNLYKEFGMSILRMTALVDFIENCMEPDGKPVTLNNPINIYGNIVMGKEETLPLVTSALTEEKKKAMELVRQMKVLLDEADFETWNCVVVSQKRRAAVEKWKETLKDEDGGIHATFDLQPGGLVEQYRRKEE